MRLRIGVGPVVTLIVLAIGVTSQARAATVFDLGAFVPSGLNAKDQVVGDIYDANAQNAVPHAGLWSNGVLTPLPEQPGATQSAAFAINQAGPLASFGPSSDFSQASSVDAAGDPVRQHHPRGDLEERRDHGSQLAAARELRLHPVRRARDQ
jgi:uncharacterized membrane protein